MGNRRYFIDLIYSTFIRTKLCLSNLQCIDRITHIGTASPTLIEDLPDLGMVAAFAVDKITSQLGARL